MHDIETVQILDRLQSLVEVFVYVLHLDLLRTLLDQIRMIVEQTAIASIVHDHVDLVSVHIVDNIPQLDNMRMIKLAVHLDLTCNQLQLHCGEFFII